MCLALAVWVMLQLVMIAMQRKFGPRFFIPARFLPQKYDYYRPVLVVDGHVQVDPNGTTGTRARPISSTTRSGYTSLPATINRFTASVRSAVGDCLFRFRNTRSSGDTQGAFASVRPDDDDSDAVDVHDPEAAPSTPGGRSNGRRMVVPASAPAAGVDVTDMPSITLTPPAAGEGAPALGSIDCVICMTEVTVSDRDYMVTPCLHLFHEACLQQWMDVKMECPTCRTVLPPP